MSSNQDAIAATASHIASGAATAAPALNAESTRRSGDAVRSVGDSSTVGKPSTGVDVERLRLNLTRMKQEDSVLSLDEEKRFREAQARGDKRGADGVLRGAVQRTEREIRALQEATPAEIRTITKVMEQPWSSKSENRVQEILDGVASRTGNDAARVAGEARAGFRQAEPKDAVAQQRGSETGRVGPAAPSRGDEEATRVAQQRMLELRERLAQQFVVEGNRYLYRGRVSVIDEGRSITSYDTTKRTVQAVVDLAEVKQWREINVQGKPEFQRAVWTEARARGIEVRSERPPTQSDQEAVRAIAAQRRAGLETGSSKGEPSRPSDRVAGAETGPTPALAALEKVLRQAGASQEVVDRALRIGAERESSIRNEGRVIEVRGVDPNAVRTVPVPSVQLQERAAPARAR